MYPPVLLLVYNRPTHTKKVLYQLQKCGVTEIYVSGDGPKNSKDVSRCAAVKKEIGSSGIAVVREQYHTTNTGCKDAVLSGVSWFFKQVESGIILEDDCFPSLGFFQILLPSASEI